MLMLYIYINFILEAEVIKEKVKPAPEKKGLKLFIFLLSISCMLPFPQIYILPKLITFQIAYLQSLYYIILEAEVIKEKVAPVKKGINMNEIIIYFRFQLYDDHSSHNMLLSHSA